MEIKISVNPSITVSGLVLAPDDARACFVLAHGAGAGMRHSFMGMVATGFSKRRIATLRYQFPYMEKGSRRPDGPALAHATVRAAVAEFGEKRKLHADYYSFDVVGSDEARARWVAPDLRALEIRFILTTY